MTFSHLLLRLAAQGDTPYPRKMAADLPFLPAPVAADPLLVEWYSAQLPWLIASHPRSTGQLAGLEELVREADSAAIDTSEGRRRHRDLLSASKLIYADAHRAKLTVGAGALLRDATRRAPH